MRGGSQEDRLGVGLNEADRIGLVACRARSMAPHPWSQTAWVSNPSSKIPLRRLIDPPRVEHATWLSSASLWALGS